MDGRFFKKKCDLTYKELASSLQSHFPIDYDTTQSECLLYPFSNELNYSTVLGNLKNKMPLVTDKIKIAIVFGESNFISMLPELSIHADLLIMADIEPKIHKHNQYLWKCFNEAQAQFDFLSLYYNGNNPILNEILPWLGQGAKAEKHILQNMLYGKNDLTRQSLGEFHVLWSEERFHVCKQAFNKIEFIQINFDLMNANQSEELASLLNKSNAIITFCNFTNIHDYIGGTVFLPESTRRLLQYSPNSLIMYAVSQEVSQNTSTTHFGQLFRISARHNLTTTLSEGLSDYYKHALKLTELTPRFIPY